jgi:hypothetical protein
MAEMMRGRMATVLMLAALAGCSDADGPKDLDRAALMDPASCESCHIGHFNDWSGSMHAYAGDDPVFLAMNARGQRETDGALGDFCVKCHAPVALMTGATTDGLNLPELPQHLKGVTCFFCHTVNAVNGTHNNPLTHADDNVLYGGIAAPFETSAHESAYSPLLDRDRRESADMCGACHDIVTPAGVHLERTYAEWKETQFGNGVTALLTCSNCHMPGRPGPAADVADAPMREVHAHSWPGVDVALTPFAGVDAQKALVQDELDSAVIAQLCVDPPLADSKIQVVLENGFAGHNFPSGAAQDRRVWVELIAYQADAVIFESGVVAAAEPVAELSDPNLWLLRDKLLDEQGAEVHMFWQAASFESELLPQAAGPGDPHTLSKVYTVPLSAGLPDKATLRLLIRPMGLEVLQSLVDSGDLDPAVVAAMPTFTVVNEITWTDADGFGCTPADPFSG